jgi:uncharacterized protein (TIGR00369 family)
LTEFSTQRVEIIVPITEQIEQQHGFVHGGVISYAADNALTFAGGSVLGAAVVTSEFKINFLKPAMGARLLARANVLYAGKSQAVCRCDVFSESADGTETLCAAAQGTIVNFRKPPENGSRCIVPKKSRDRLFFLFYPEKSLSPCPPNGCGGLCPRPGRSSANSANEQGFF